MEEVDLERLLSLPDNESQLNKIINSNLGESFPYLELLLSQGQEVFNFEKIANYPPTSFLLGDYHLDQNLEFLLNLYLDLCDDNREFLFVTDKILFTILLSKINEDNLKDESECDWLIFDDFEKGVMKECLLYRMSEKSKLQLRLEKDFKIMDSYIDQDFDSLDDVLCDLEAYIYNLEWNNKIFEENIQVLENLLFSDPE